MKFSSLSVVAAAITCYIWAAQAVPAWDMYNSRQSIGNFVPGATLVFAYGPTNSGNTGQLFLRSTKPPGQNANVTVARWQDGLEELGAPPMFFVSQGQLYQITNHTHILYADLVNATSEIAARDWSGYHPKQSFRLRLNETKPAKSVFGTWEWAASMLTFRMGNKSNNGLFYQCNEPTGEIGVYVPLDAAKTPAGCDILSLVSHTINIGRK